MEDKKLNRVFDRVKLSHEREEAMLADLLRVKKEVSSMKQINRRRIPVAALVAAVLVIVLAGTAVAVGYFDRLDVSPVAGNYENGYNVQGAYQNIPPERLSEELLERAARKGTGSEELDFNSWSEAEEFLGLEVANNPMLEEMAQSEWEPPHEGDATPEDARICTVQMYYHQGLPDQILLRGSYWIDYFEEGPFGVNVLAFMRVKAEEQEELPVSLGVGGKLENIRAETYVTPSGMEVAIFTQDGTGIAAVDNTTFQQSFYTAYFELHNAVFELYTAYNERNADAALNLLKQVLDAYE